LLAIFETKGGFGEMLTELRRRKVSEELEDSQQCNRNERIAV
jgi:hypothetical protein